MNPCDYTIPSLVPTVTCTAEFLHQRWAAEIGPRILISMYEAIAGLVIAMILSVIGAAAASTTPTIRKLVDGLALSSQVIPPVLAVPILLYLPLGANWGIYFPRIALAAAFAAYPAYQILYARIRRIEASTRELLAIYPVDRQTRWLKIIVPLEIPDFFLSLQVATPLALAGAIVGEWATGSGSTDRGLASTFIVAARNLYPNQAAGALIVLVFLAATMYGIVVSLRSWFIPRTKAAKFSLD